MVHYLAAQVLSLINQAVLQKNVLTVMAREISKGALIMFSYKVDNTLCTDDVSKSTNKEVCQQKGNILKN